MATLNQSQPKNQVSVWWSSFHHQEARCRPTNPQGCTSRKSPREPARSQGVGTAVAAFVGLAETGPFNRPTLISNWTQFNHTFGGFVAGSYLAHGLRILHERRRQLLRRPDRPGSRLQRPAPSRRAEELAAAPHAQIGRLKVTVIDPAVQPNEVSVEITDPGGDNPGPEAFELVVKRNGQLVEEYDNGHAGKGKQTSSPWSTPSRSDQPGEETSSGAVERQPATGSARAEPAMPRCRRRAVSADDYVGDVADRTGFGGPGGRRRGHHAQRARPDERLPAGRHRPGERCRRCRPR